MLSAIAIGLGFSSQASTQDIVALVSGCLREAPAHQSAEIFTLARKADSAALREAAALLGFDLGFLDEAEFAARQQEFSVRGAAGSALVEAHTGFASVAEAAALMGGGPQAVLIVKKVARATVTCAIAARREEV
jgi:cobalamin biosynthesis protein CbiG